MESKLSLVQRITFDLMRRIPLRPLVVSTRVVRAGKRTQLVDAALIDGEPRTLGVKQLLAAYCDHRFEVIRRNPASAGGRRSPRSSGR